MIITHCVSYDSKFVTVHQQLLSVVIGKHGLLSLFFFTEPVRVALVGIEGIVDVSFLYPQKRRWSSVAED